MIKRIFNLIAFLVLIQSCGFKDKPSKDKLQGDWISKTIKTNWHERRFMFSFEDTLCTY